ncbi:MAG TPA: PBP1A family penicillin-binding protein [Chthoniobacterales bacterium]|jgi:penicillin-binding protein 1A|nr:PBP1A family penicillin-binding protein [Chthoniobacterales bacterium]
MPVDYYTPTEFSRSERAWYARRWFYLPVIVVLVLLLAGLLAFIPVAVSLKQQAAALDLKHLEQMESASVIVDRNNKIFGQIYVENRETVPYDQLPSNLINAIIATEDNKFYQHHGYDLLGIVRAALKNLVAGHVRQGASTITQQLARNSFELKGKTFRRKLLEMFVARRIEENFSKQKIIELYLNRIYFGGGLYGAEAAARGYFDKPAREMTLAECATLAGLIKSPNKLSPWSDRQASREARNFVLSRMEELGFINESESRNAQAQEIVVGNRQNARGQNYAIDYIRQQVIAAVGWDRAMSDGFRIHTTIDAQLQNVAEKSLRAQLDAAEQTPGYDHQTYAQYVALLKEKRADGNAGAPPAPDYLQGAVIALDNKTGGILALVGGRDFEHNEYNRALQAKRPPGTAMLPFVYAAAFEKGLYPGSLVDDSALDNRTVMIGGTTGILGEWGPENAGNRYEGQITAREALAESKNGSAVRIGTTAGLDTVTELVHKAGVETKLRPYPATFLGSSVINLGELALAYTVFPNEGWHPAPPHILDRIEDKSGHIVWQTEKARGHHPVIKPAVAYEVTSCLTDALHEGTGQLAYTKYGLKKFPAAGKTGTAYDFTDALFAGYDSQLTCVVWAGFDKPQKIYRGAFGSVIALPVWVDVMNASIARYPPREFPVPPEVHKIEICSRSGLLATDKCYDDVKSASGNLVRRRTSYFEFASDEQMPVDSCDVHGDSVRTQLVKKFESSQWPRAALAINTDAVSPVIVQGQTLVANQDPYGAVGSTYKPKTLAKQENQPPSEFDPDKPIKRALPVAPAALDGGIQVQRAVPVVPTAPDGQVEVRRAQPVRPIDEVGQEPLLQTEPPEPLDFSDDH